MEQGGKALPERPFPCDGGIVNVAGAGIFVLFAVRHILNWRWYKNIFQGKYLLLLCLFLYIIYKNSRKNRLHML